MPTCNAAASIPGSGRACCPRACQHYPQLVWGKGKPSIPAVDARSFLRRNGHGPCRPGPDILPWSPFPAIAPGPATARRCRRTGAPSAASVAVRRVSCPQPCHPCVRPLPPRRCPFRSSRRTVAPSSAPPARPARPCCTSPGTGGRPRPSRNGLPGEQSPRVRPSSPIQSPAVPCRHSRTDAPSDASSCAPLPPSGPDRHARLAVCPGRSPSAGSPPVHPGHLAFPASGPPPLPCVLSCAGPPVPVPSGGRRRGLFVLSRGLPAGVRAHRGGKARPHGLSCGPFLDFAHVFAET